MRAKTLVIWFVETLIVPVIPIGLAALFRRVSQVPLDTREPLFWSPEIPLATMFIGITCIFRFEGFKSTWVRSELLSALQVLTVVLIALAFGILVFYYTDRELVWGRRIPAPFRGTLMGMQWALGITVALEALVLEFFERMGKKVRRS